MMEIDAFKRFMPTLVVIVLALAARLAALVAVPVDTKPWSDSSQYINLAGSMAEGTGYQLSVGNFWPGKPTIIRAPGWPLVLSMPFKVISQEWRWTLTRLLAVAFDVLNAVIIMMVARAMGGSALAAGLAGGLYALNPVSAALAAQAGSEPCGVTFLLLFLLSAVTVRKGAAGTAATTREGARLGTAATTIGRAEHNVVPVSSPAVGGEGAAGDSRYYNGTRRESAYFCYFLPGLMLGLACLVRANWLAIAGCFGLAFCWVHRAAWRRSVLQMAVFGFAVMLPLMPWVARNYVVFHHLPILGAGGGETFYGGNNDLAADRHSPMWGYIVQPGGIPGAVPLATLAATMNEYEVDKYWMREGWAWLKANPGKIPELIAGKLRRAFVPVPYNSRGPVVLAASAFRALLYVATVVGLILMVRKRIAMPVDVGLLFGAVVVANVATAVIFCGVMRYVIGFEILLCIPAGWVISKITWHRMVARGE